MNTEQSSLSSNTRFLGVSRVSSLASGLLLALSLLSHKNATAQGIDPSPVVLSGLVGWWRGENNAVDSAGTNNGTTVNGASFSEGMVGQAFSLDGIDDYIDVPNAPDLNPTDAISVEVWYKPTISFVGSGNDSLVDKGYTSHTPPYYQYHLGVLGDLRGAQFDFSVAADGKSYGASTPEGVWSVGNWYHIVGTYGGGSINLYVNGVLIDSEPASGKMTDYVKNLEIGSLSNINAHTPGLIDEVSIYNRALTANEVKSLFAAGSAGKRFVPSPTISTQPRDQSVLAGTKVTFQVVATSIEPDPLTFQWRKYGMPLIGQTNSALALMNVQDADEGSYDVVITDIHGSSTRSATASLQILLPPIVSWGPAPDHAPDVLWAKEAGGPDGYLPNGFREAGAGLAAAVGDGQGGAYVAGSFSGAYGRFGNLEINKPGADRVFYLIKLDEQGNPLWERHNWGESGISDLAVTPDGGLILAGSLLTKFDKEGNQQWQLVHDQWQVEWTLGQRYLPTLKIDRTGTIYLLGGFTDSPGFSWNSMRGLFIAKYKPSGDLISTKTIVTVAPGSGDGILFEAGTRFDMDEEGNLYLILGASTDGRWNPGTMAIGNLEVPVPGVDGGYFSVFAAKLNSSLETLWVKNMGSTAFPGGIRADSAGNSYATYNPGIFPQTGTMVKYDSYGHELWNTSPLGLGRGFGPFTCDPAGNIVVVVGYDPVYPLKIRGFSEFPSGVAIVGIKPSGQVNWARLIPESGESTGAENPSVDVLAQASSDSWFMGGQIDDFAIIGGHRVQAPWPLRDYEAFVVKIASPKPGAAPIVTVDPQAFSPISMYTDAGDPSQGGYGRFAWTNSGPWGRIDGTPSTNGITVFESMPLQLQVFASSYSIPGYQWLLNGSPIPGATTNSLSFTSATIAIDGKYSALVLNESGSTESARTPVTVLPLTKLGDALNAPHLIWRMGGSRSWELDTQVTHDGALSARTPFLDPGQDCWIETTVQGAGVLGFWWKTSIYDLGSYSGDGDYAPNNRFQFLIDGIPQYELSGEVDWTPHALSITGDGPHTIRWAWAFPSRNSYLGNQNLSWVDEVKFATGTSARPRITSATFQADSSFQLKISGTAGANYGIEASSDLKTWLPVGQVTASNGSATFTHRTAANYIAHFYRIFLIPPQ